LAWVALTSLPVFAEEGPGGYLVGGPSETFQPPTLDLERVYYGVFEKGKEGPTLRPRVREAKPLTTPVIKEVPTVAEVEAAKAKATAESAMEVSQKAETIANQANQTAAEARAISERAIAAANEAIQKANAAIDKTNQTIDRVNEINKNLVQEIARLRYELNEKDESIEEEIANLKKEIEAMKVKPPETYRVKKGDYLIKIAGKKEVYGDASQWQKIYRANRKKIKNPNLIYPGQNLVIPR